MSTVDTPRPEEIAFVRTHSEGSCTGRSLWTVWRDVDRQDGTAERGASCGDCGAKAWWGERRQCL